MSLRREAEFLAAVGRMAAALESVSRSFVRLAAVLEAYAGRGFVTMGDGDGERQGCGDASDEGREVGGSGEEGRGGAARLERDEEAGEVDEDLRACLEGPGWSALQAWSQAMRAATGSSPADVGVAWRDPEPR